MPTRREFLLSLVMAPVLLTSCSSSCDYEGDVAGAVQYAQGLGKYENKTIQVTGNHSTLDYETRMITLKSGDGYEVAALFESDVRNPTSERITIRGRLISAMTKHNEITMSECKIIE